MTIWGIPHTNSWWGRGNSNVGKRQTWSSKINCWLVIKECFCKIEPNSIRRFWYGCRDSIELCCERSILIKSNEVKLIDGDEVFFYNLWECNFLPFTLSEEPDIPDCAYESGWGDSVIELHSFWYRFSLCEACFLTSLPNSLFSGIFACYNEGARCHSL